MQSNNPAFSKRPEFSRQGAAPQAGYPQQYGQQQYGQQYGNQPGYAPQPGYGPDQYAQGQQYGTQPHYGLPPHLQDAQRQTDAMTIDDVITRAAMLFGIMGVMAAGTWVLTTGQPQWIGPLWIGTAIATLVMGLVIAFSKRIMPPLIMAYAALEGVFVGAISRAFEFRWDGIVGQAILATMGAFVAMLIAYKVGAIRATPRFTKILIIATLGYAIFMLFQFVSVAFLGGPSIMSMGMLGLGITILGVSLASLNLVLDFNFIEQGIANRVPREFSWLAAHGLLVTLVWLYVEMLRLIAILRGDD